MKITPEAVKERIAALESAGELSLKEQFYLEALRELEVKDNLIAELQSELSEWTDCKHDGATYYDMSGRDRCGRCGADI